tara:strand:- start:59 stop:334 length:276 start_codon:yes stop_codon:yes gene_type:complete
MKSYKTFKTEELVSLEEALNISKLKRLKLVSDEEFSQFVRVMRKMDAEKPITIKEKDSIMKVFDELVKAILNDQAIMQKIAKRKSGDEEED